MSTDEKAMIRFTMPEGSTVEDAEELGAAIAKIVALLDPNAEPPTVTITDQPGAPPRKEEGETP